jgi:hypothetical protein
MDLLGTLRQVSGRGVVLLVVDCAVEQEHVKPKRKGSDCSFADRSTFRTLSDMTLKTTAGFSK